MKPGFSLLSTTMPAIMQAWSYINRKSNDVLFLIINLGKLKENTQNIDAATCKINTIIFKAYYHYLSKNISIKLKLADLINIHPSIWKYFF